MQVMLLSHLRRLPDPELYQPRFSPWLGGGEFGEILNRARPHTLVSEASCYTLYILACQALGLGGEVWECGVFKGGSALLLAELMRRRRVDPELRLRLFDTFDGMPAIDPHQDVPYPKRDARRPEDLEEATLERVRERLSGYPRVSFHPGLIPATFGGLEKARIALAHIDVDLYQSVWTCCQFIYERLLPGGFMIFDDYGYASCPGARKAVDAFFRHRPEEPLVSPTGQAIVFKTP